MATGYLYKTQCFPTLADATAARWGDEDAGITPGTTSYIADVQWSGSAWVLKRYTLSSTGTLTLNTTTNLPALSFPTCDTTSNFSDGAVLGWGVAAAMVAAYAVKFIAQGLHR